MTFTRILLRLAVLAAAIAGMAAMPAVADEISQAQMAAALEAVAANPLSQIFNNQLSVLSRSTESQLIRQRPDLYAQIPAAVNGVALKLAGRVADLNNDLARIWARAFTEDELKQIAAFYRSPVGVKLMATAPDVVSESSKVLKGWSDRVGEELLEKSREELKKQGYDF